MLRPERLSEHITRIAHPVQGPLGDWVAQVWALEWDAPIPPADTAVISHPSLHLTVEAGPSGEIRHGHALPAAPLHGVVTNHFRVELPAGGWVIGLHLQPGAFADWAGIAAYPMTDRVEPLDACWPGWDLTAVWAADDLAGCAAALSAAAEQRLPTSVSVDGRLARDIATAVGDSAVTTVEALAAACGLGVRRLQRICRHHVGVSPGWLLRRARVLDGHELLLSTELPIAEIAARLGWCDQAHFTRNYAAITGVPPAARRRERHRER